MLAVGVAVERRILSPHADVGRTGVANAVRLAAMDLAGVAVEVEVMDEDEEKIRGQKQAAAEAGTARTHGVAHGKTKTRRGREITIGNEDTTKKWPK
jgi:hypothetical protein